MDRTAERTTFPRALALLGASAMFMEILDATIVVTALPAIASDFGVSALDATGVVTSYLMTLAVVIPVSGWAAQRWGVRPVFLTAMAVFTLASLGCALAGGLGWLIAARVIQAAGGAMMVPVGRLAVLRSVDRSDLVRAIAYLTWPALVAPVVAPVLGGLIVTHWSWRVIFYINVPLGVVGLVAAAIICRPDKTSVQPRRLDVPGLVGSAIAIAAIMVVAHELTGSPPRWVVVGVGAAIAILAGAWTIRHLRRATDPLLDLSALQHHSFASVMSYGSLYRAVITAVPFLVPIMFQVRFGWSPTAAGAMVTALFVGNLAIKPFTTTLMRVLGIKRVLVYDTAISVAGFVALAFVGPAIATGIIAALLVVSGALRSIGFSAYNTLAFTDVGPDELPHANALHAAAQELSAALGVAAAAVAVAVGASLGADALPAGPYGFAFLLLAVLTIVMVVGALRLPRDAGDVSVGRH
ncbi:MFS transporter [Gordonia sp. NPDC003585]|uniref:MFS transporter n=1 Tax=Gordonia sp. NPDC003585 TaxID=3154275 RepID=UPI0033A4F297